MATPVSSFHDTILAKRRQIERLLLLAGHSSEEKALDSRLNELGGIVDHFRVY